MKGRAGAVAKGKLLRIRLMLLVLVATFGQALAADWQMLPGSPAGAVPQAQRSQDAGVPRIINGIVTGGYPAVAALQITNAEGDSLCTGTLVSRSVILTAAHCVATPPTAIDAFFFPDGVTPTAYSAVGYAIHPAFVFPHADLAMLLLEAPVVGIDPTPLASRKPRPRAVGTIEIGRASCRD